jgi:hypothetical protein
MAKKLLNNNYSIYYIYGFKQEIQIIKNHLLFI